MYERINVTNKAASIEHRRAWDAHNIRAICNKYKRNTTTKQLYEPPPFLKVMNYFLDKNTKLGWCLNAKVNILVAHRIHLLIT